MKFLDLENLKKNLKMFDKTVVMPQIKKYGVSEEERAQIESNKEEIENIKGDYARRSEIPTNVSQLYNDTQYASKSDVDTAIANLVDSAPEEMNTLKELSEAIKNHDVEYDGLLEVVGNKANKSDIPTKTSQLENDCNFIEMKQIHPRPKTYHETFPEYFTTRGLQSVGYEITMESLLDKIWVSNDAFFCSFLKENGERLFFKFNTNLYFWERIYLTKIYRWDGTNKSYYLVDENTPDEESVDIDYDNRITVNNRTYFFVKRKYTSYYEAFVAIVSFDTISFYQTIYSRTTVPNKKTVMFYNDKGNAYICDSDSNLVEISRLPHDNITSPDTYDCSNLKFTSRHSGDFSPPTSLRDMIDSDNWFFTNTGFYSDKTYAIYAGRHVYSWEYANEFKFYKDISDYDMYRSFIYKNHLYCVTRKMVVYQCNLEPNGKSKYYCFLDDFTRLRYLDVDKNQNDIRLYNCDFQPNSYIVTVDTSYLMHDGKCYLEFNNGHLYIKNDEESTK